MNQYIKNQNHLDSGSESVLIGSWGSSSSSSFLNTSFESELDSNEEENDEDEFIAELTRRMTEYMLDADDNPPPENSGLEKPATQESMRRSYADIVKKSIIDSKPNQSYSDDHQIQPPIQLYKVEDQPRVGGARRGKMTESTQYSNPNRHDSSRVGRGEKGKFVNGAKGFLGPLAPVGLGMRAIFLDGSGSQTGSGGTGFFLPRSAADATDVSRKKKGCSTVLIPTRVLLALEQHFSNMESLSSSNSVAQVHPNQQADVSDTQEHSQATSVSESHEDSELPPEWIY